MNDRRIKEALRDIAQREAGDPLSQAITSFAVRFAEAVTISGSAEPGKSVDLNSGTASLVNLGDGPIAVTCSHVLDSWRKKHAKDPAAFLQIGNLRVDVDEALIDEDPDADLATLRLSTDDVRRIQSDARSVPLQIHSPVRWPPEPIKDGDRVSLSGYPGVWRQTPQGRRLWFDSFSLGNVPVQISSGGDLVLSLDQANWLQSYGHAGMDLAHFGGVSGGPVFIDRGLYWEFAGIIYEHAPNYEVLFARSAARIRSDGTLGRT